MVKKYKLYCQRKVKDGGIVQYNHFFGGEFQVKMIGVASADIAFVEVEVLENQEPTDGVNYWGWLDFADDTINFIAPNKTMVEICSPDSFKSEIADGKGRLVLVGLRELEKPIKTLKR